MLKVLRGGGCPLLTRALGVRTGQGDVTEVRGGGEEEEEDWGICSAWIDSEAVWEERETRGQCGEEEDDVDVYMQRVDGWCR